MDGALMTRPQPMLKTWCAGDADLQAQAAVAVVIPTILRPTLARALTSIFAQHFDGRIQVLVGIDQPQGSPDMLDSVCRAAPSHVVVQALYPGYSTSVRHGGLCAAWDGGALRTILSYMANAPLIAYLDDDNWWAPQHLSTLAHAIQPVDWAFAQRWFVHPETTRPVCIDAWESIGLDAGVYENCGGWVDPNCLMIKRTACAPVIPWWTVPLSGDGNEMTADRLVFDYLRRNRKSAGTNEASVFYTLDPADGLHRMRLELIGDAYRDAGAA
jgi:hypothetical protein